MRFQVLAAGLCLSSSACSEIFSRGHDPTLGESNNNDGWSWEESETNISSISDGVVADESTNNSESSGDGAEDDSDASQSDATTLTTATDTHLDGDGSATTDASDASESENDEGDEDGQSGTETVGTSAGTGDSIGSTDDSIDTTEDPDPVHCQELHFIFRDFSDVHEDFEVFAGEQAFRGIVEPEIGFDRKPKYAHLGPTEQTSGPLQFSQWYNDGQSSLVFEETIRLTETSPGFFDYINHEFFPLDEKGWGNQDRIHNYHFTSEVHAEFDYLGGETITLGGDDDLWLFINGVLAIDLGGLHPPLSKTIDLDESATEFGIRIGNRYAVEFFHAERHTVGSNFILETNIDCLMPRSSY